MAERYEFFIEGKSEPGGSKRAFPLPNGRFNIVDANPNVKSYRRDVADSARIAVGEPKLITALRMIFIFVRVRPKFHYGTGKNAGVLKDSAPRYPTTKPDSTKLTRSTEDALTGILWKDDPQVVDQIICKRYGEVPGVHVIVEEMD